MEKEPKIDINETDTLWGETGMCRLRASKTVGHVKLRPDAIIDIRHCERNSSYHKCEREYGL